jgi:haloalkane dehalogenase
MRTTTPAWLDTEQWPYLPKDLEVPDGTLSLVDEGQGEPMVFVHGTPTWSYEWRALLRALRGQRRVMAFDHLGFGLSSRPVGADYSPEGHARRFGQAMAALQLREPVTLVVHDFGGPIALDWALTHPERVKRLVVLNSWMWGFRDDEAMWRRGQLVAGRVGRFLYRVFNASQRLIMPSAFGDRRLLTPALHRQYLSAFADAGGRELVLWALAKSLTQSTAYFDGLWARREALKHTPMTIVWGMKDSAFRPDCLAKWTQAFAQARVVELPNAGHWPHEEAPEAVLAALT